jgi:DNA-binding transcriptional LysR family regulator
VLVLSLVAGWLAAIIDDRMLVRLAREGARRPSGGVLVARLTTTDPGTLAGAALAGLGGGLLPIIAVADSVAPGFWPVWVIPTLVVIALAGVVTIGVAEGATARMRNTWRAAWHPGDVVAPEPPRRKPRPEVGE